MLNDLNMWNKIGRIVMRLSERLDISLERAFGLFYTSKVCRDMHDDEVKLYLFSDRYIVEDLIRELRGDTKKDIVSS